MKKKALFKQSTALAMAAVLTVSALSGCGKKEAVSEKGAMPIADEEVQIADVEELSREIPESEAIEEWIEDDSVLAIDSQARIFAENQELWRLDDAWTTPVYAVMDLDDNGRMELIATYIEGSAGESSISVYEINESSDGLDEVRIMMPTGYEGAYPDFLNYCYPTFYRNSFGVKYYMIDRSVRDGYENNYETRYTVTKSDDMLLVQHLGGRYYHLTEDGDVDIDQYYGMDGSEIDFTAFYNLESDYFGDYEYNVSCFDWNSLYDCTDEDSVRNELVEMFRCFLVAEHGSNGDYTVDIYFDSSEEAYQELTGEIVRLPGIDESDHYVRFTTEAEDVEIALEWGEWYDPLNYFHPISEIFTFTMKPGVIYEFPGMLPEGRPDYRMVASRMGNTSYWYCAEEGYENGYYQMFYEESEGYIPAEGNPIMNMCEIYAAMLIEAGSMEAMTGEYLWKAMANAAMYQTKYNGEVGPDGKIYLTEWMVDEYMSAMFPYCGYTLPADDDPISYHPDHYERYTIEPEALMFDGSTTEILSAEFDEYGRVLLDISVKTDYGYEGVIMWISRDNAVQDNPFDFVIDGAGICMG